MVSEVSGTPDERNRRGRINAPLGSWETWAKVDGQLLGSNAYLGSAWPRASGRATSSSSR
jgi:hypothetical protein